MVAGTSAFDQALTKYWDWNNKGVSYKPTLSDRGFR